MTFDAFISYPHQDKAAADAACAKLEAEGIRCWIAPRDIAPSADWAASIIDAIDGCRVMVLIFSSSANRSKQVHREVQQAFDVEKPVVPFRIEGVGPEGTLRYYMGPVHWLDAVTPPLEQHLEKLVAAVAALVRPSTSGADSEVGRLQRETEARQRTEEEQRRAAQAQRRLEEERRAAEEKRRGEEEARRREAQAQQRAEEERRKAREQERLGAPATGKTRRGPPSRTGAPPGRILSRPAIVAGALIAFAIVAGIGLWLTRAPDSGTSPVSTNEAARAPIRTSGPGAISALSENAERALKPKDTFQECANCPSMIVVPAGSFVMGSPVSELTRNEQEGPQHRVTIARAFAAGRFAVTFDEWDACVADGGCDGHRPSDAGWGRGRRPVINVSWKDAKAYVAWLSRTTGKTYRLLSETEREYVARAGTTTPFWWGGSISTSQANYDGGAPFGNGAKGEYRQQTVPVDSFAPNPWGLYQVHGNVSDWTEDCFENNYAGAPTDGSARTGGFCFNRATRGGSWYAAPNWLRSAARIPVIESDSSRSVYTGIRVGRTLLAP
jgi:formylglycine-generating enzyme required for sulfatase activity